MIVSSGYAALGSDHRGDLYVHAQNAVPTKLSTEQREKLDEFAKSLGEETSPMEESFFANSFVIPSLKPQTYPARWENSRYNDALRTNKTGEQRATAVARACGLCGGLFYTHGLPMEEWRHGAVPTLALQVKKVSPYFAILLLHAQGFQDSPEIQESRP